MYCTYNSLLDMWFAYMFSSLLNLLTMSFAKKKKKNYIKFWYISFILFFWYVFVFGIDKDTKPNITSSKFSILFPNIFSSCIRHIISIHFFEWVFQYINIVSLFIYVVLFKCLMTIYNFPNTDITYIFVRFIPFFKIA